MSIYALFCLYVLTLCGIAFAACLGQALVSLAAKRSRVVRPAPPTWHDYERRRR